LKVEFEYFGSTTSMMKVIQVIDDISKEYKISFSTDIFQKHIIIFLNHHIVAWDSNYAFNGEDEVLDFYNEVIQLSE